MIKRNPTAAALISEIDTHNLEHEYVHNGRGHPRVYVTYPNGERQFIITPLTASDRRAALNAVAYFRRMLAQKQKNA